MTQVSQIPTYKKLLYLWQKVKRKNNKTIKNEMTESDKPCKSLWLVALEMPSEIGQSKFKHPLHKLEEKIVHTHIYIYIILYYIILLFIIH